MTKKAIRPPRTDLQRLQGTVAYAIGFKLQYFHAGYILRSLHASAETHRLIKQHERTVTELKQSLRADYNRQRDNILSKRAAAKGEQNSS